MAYDNTKLRPLGQDGTDGLKIWAYQSAADNSSTVLGSNYFPIADARAKQLTTGDVLVIKSTDKLQLRGVTNNGTAISLAALDA
jgi:hypothetical protein